MCDSEVILNAGHSQRWKDLILFFSHQTLVTHYVHTTGCYIFATPLNKLKLNFLLTNKLRVFLLVFTKLNAKRIFQRDLNNILHLVLKKKKYRDKTIYKQQPPLSANISTDICQQTWSVLKCKQFPDSKAKKKLQTSMNRQLPTTNTRAKFLLQMMASVFITHQIFLQCTRKMFTNNHTVCCMLLFLLCVLWHDLMNNQACPFYFNNS